jgi:hypothetical protein
VLLDAKIVRDLKMAKSCRPVEPLFKGEWQFPMEPPSPVKWAGRGDS